MKRTQWTAGHAAAWLGIGVILGGMIGAAVGVEHAAALVDEADRRAVYYQGMALDYGGRHLQCVEEHSSCAMSHEILEMAEETWRAEAREMAQENRRLLEQIDTMDQTIRAILAPEPCGVVLTDLPGSFDWYPGVGQ